MSVMNMIGTSIEIAEYGIHLPANVSPSSQVSNQTLLKPEFIGERPKWDLWVKPHRVVLKGGAIVRPGPVFDRGRGHQNGRGGVFPIIPARQEPQRYKNEILVV